MNIIARALCLDATLKAAIVTIIGCICDAQIVNSLLRSKVNSEKLTKKLVWSHMREKREELIWIFFNCHFLSLAILILISSVAKLAAVYLML